MTTKAICVWLDSTSEPGNSTWIVSLDRIDSEGNAETTTTLTTADDFDDALDAATAEGAKRGLPVYLNSEGEAPSLLVAAPSVEE